MLNHTVYVIPATGQRADAAARSAEPSHIHIPRPSRRARRNLEYVVEAEELIATAEYEPDPALATPQRLPAGLAA
jgi:hypothetical protein